MGAGLRSGRDVYGHDPPCADGVGAIDDLPLSITVSAPAQGFAINSTPSRFVTVGETYTYAVTTTAPASQPAVFTLIDPPLGMNIDPVSGVLTWPSAVAAAHRITIRANDRVGNEAFQSFVLAVRPVNTPPVVTPPADVEVTVRGEYRDRATAADTADGFRFSLAPAAPVGLSIDPITGVVLWPTITAVTGEYTVTIRATDDRGAVGEADFTITVVPDTTTPEVTVIVEETRVDPGTEVEVTVAAIDDVGVVELELTVNGVNVPLTDGEATFTPTAPGVYELTATATDAAGNTETTTVRLKVTDPNDNEKPVINITAPQQGALITYVTDLVGTITDANLDTYRVEISRSGTNQWRQIGSGTAANASGVLAVIDPTLLDNDQYTVRITATDINGLTEVADLFIELEGQAKVGNFRQEFIDLQVPLAGIPVTITRVYDTLQADKAGDFGFGWSLGVGYDPRPRETVPTNPAESILGMFAAVPFKAGTRVYVTTPDGRRVGFTFEPQLYDGIIGAMGGPTNGMFKPYFKPDPGVFETLAGEFDGSGEFQLPLIKVGNNYHLAAIGVAYNPVGYRLTTKDGLSYHFGQSNGLQSITDRNGVKLTFSKNGISSSLGTSITFVRDAQGRIEKIIDPAGKPITYTYDAHGDLVGMTDQENREEQYKYTDPQRPHYLTEIVSLCGCYPSVRMEYDENGRLSGQKNALDERVTLGYDLGDFTETYTDQLQRTTTYVYDSRGNVLSKTDPLDRTWTYTYDANDNQTSVTDPKNHTTTRTYDARGNPLTVTDAATHTWTATYNGFNLPLTVTDARTHTTTYRYDPRGNLVETIDTESGVWEQQYDLTGRATVRTDPEGRTVTYRYDQPLDVPSVTTMGDGATTITTYDWFGMPISTVDPLGHERLSVYDGTGLPRALRDANGYWTFLTYDANKRLETVTDPNGNVTRYEYDDANRKTAEVTATGTRRWDYDDAGQMIRYEDRNGRVATYEYDLAGRLEFEKWYATADLTAPPVNTVTSKYDRADNLSEISDGTSRNVFDYDERNLLVTADNEGTPGAPRVILTYEYDENGNVVGTTDNRGASVISTYDNRNLLSSRTWEGTEVGSVAGYEYDSSGKLIRVERSSAGTEAGFSEMSYDPVGRVARQTHVGSSGAVLADYRYGHDLNGRVTEEVRQRGRDQLRLRLQRTTDRGRLRRPTGRSVHL